MIDWARLLSQENYIHTYLSYNNAISRSQCTVGTCSKKLYHFSFMINKGPTIKWFFRNFLFSNSKSIFMFPSTTFNSVKNKEALQNLKLLGYFYMFIWLFNVHRCSSVVGVKSHSVHSFFKPFRTQSQISPNYKVGH